MRSYGESQKALIETQLRLAKDKWGSDGGNSTELRDEEDMIQIKPSILRDLNDSSRSMYQKMVSYSVND